MAYERQNFKDGDVLKASHLNHIEDGIEEAGNGVDNPFTPLPVEENVAGSMYSVDITKLQENTRYYLSSEYSPSVVYLIAPSKKNGNELAGPYERLSALDEFNTMLVQVKRTERTITDSLSTHQEIDIWFTDGITEAKVHYGFKSDDGEILQFTTSVTPKLALAPYNTHPHYPVNEFNVATKGYVDSSIEKAFENADSPTPNWNDNDPSSNTYISGRTHYEELDPDNATDTLTWDGDATGKVMVPLDEEGGVYIVKISDSAPTPADLVGGSLTVVGMAEEPQTLTLTEDIIMSESGMTQVGGDVPFLMIFEQDMVNEDFTLPAGTYSIWMGGAVYVSQVTCVTPAFGTKIVHPLPEKFIPEMSSVTLVSPNGTRFKVTVDDSGTLSATEVTE